MDETKRSNSRTRKGQKGKFSGKKTDRNIKHIIDANDNGIDDSRESNMGNTRGGNDVSWYAADPALLRDSASIPYGIPIGSSFDLGNSNFVRGDFAAFPDRISGIGTLSLVTGPGLSIDNNSAVNIAARNIYSFVRHANSGSSNYDSQDLMLYILALDELYMWHFNACRAYGLMSLYNNENRYFPKAAVAALGFDFEDLKNNLAQFRYAINVNVTRIASMCVPATMPLFKRHAWLYSSIYLDGGTSKSQAYAYVPEGFRIYDETGTTGGVSNK